MMPLCLAALLGVGADPLPPPQPLAPDSTPLCAIPIHPRPVKPTPLFDRLDERFPPRGPLAICGALPMPPGSFLWCPRYRIDFALIGPPRPYCPQPGDIVLSADGSVFWKVMHNVAGTSHPTHSMVVFARPDGSMGILEGGPHDTLHCRSLDALPHMFSYEAEGRVWVRRRAVPLTPEQSARLTEFALSTDGKRFGIGRLGLQLTAFRTRGPVKTAFLGKPHGIERESYYCSELVMEALVYAGLVDCRTARPSATYPRDIFFDASANPYLNRHLKLYPEWDPPARWTSTPEPVGPTGKEGLRPDGPRR
jgi:hypothetical protein